MMSTENEYKIQPMSKEDIAEVMQIVAEANLSYWSYEGYKAELENSDSFCVVARLCNKSNHLVKEQNNVIGFLVSRLIMQENFADLFNIGIISTYRHQKVGKTLLTSFIKHCTDNNLEKINLEVRVSNTTAIEFYKKFGFEVLCTNKNFYRNPTEDAYVMVKSLNND